MKTWLLLFAFIGCLAVAQEDDTEPFDGGVDDWGFEEGAGTPKAEMPTNPNTPPPPPPGNLPGNLPHDDSGSASFSGGGFGGGGFSGGGGGFKAGAVHFYKTGEKRPPVSKKNWLEIKKSLMK